ncbi:SigE family RNA polymerase sigma factor [Intrasporangium sp. DVR]|uniref:SigE family RNA polymerase sigma factor n=1 Tax=Intrasporangium sp. DVR TaxID=3127867 RepID=UPI00313A4E9F
MAASRQDATGGASDLPEDADRAITELYAAHWHRLVRLAWLLLHDQLAAEDAVQDAFVATHRSWSSIRETGRAVGYLHTAVVNTCRSAQRHQVVVDRQNAREAGAADVPGRGSLDSAETQVLYAAERASMVSSLRALPHRQREVLVLRYYLDLSEAQIAETLDISPGSVKAHAHRGLSTLRAQLSPQRPYSGPDVTEVEQS